MKGLSLVVGLALVTSSANAAIDLRSQISGPAALAVDVPATYQVSVQSAGTTTQLKSIVSIYLPIGASATGLAQNCSVSTKYVLKCTIGTMTQGSSYTTSFIMSSPAPVRNWGLRSKASGQYAESSPANNESTINLSISAPLQNSINIVGPVNVRTDLCTFHTPFVPDFALCDYASVNGGNLVLAAGGNVLYGGVPRGTWSQSSPALFSMVFGTATYSGYAVSPTCFEGAVVYSDNPDYAAAFHLCLKY